MTIFGLQLNGPFEQIGMHKKSHFGLPLHIAKTGLFFRTTLFRI